MECTVCFAIFSVFQFIIIPKIVLCSITHWTKGLYEMTKFM